MYTEQDVKAIRQRTRKYSVILAAVLIVLVVLYVLGMIRRWQAWVMIDGALMVCAFCFIWFLYLYPCVKYQFFLSDMQSGLAHKLAGCIVEISKDEELQDGARVLPVRILLTEEQDERIVYLNVSKLNQFPPEGTEVKLDCFGRHIKAVEAL